MIKKKGGNKLKRIHYIGIIIVLLVVVGLFIMSPYSPLNKASITGKSINIPSGYTVQNSTGHSLEISNGSNTINIYAHNKSNIKSAIASYKNEHNKTFNITQKDIPIDSGEEVIMTTGNKYNDTKTVIYRYWFTKNKRVYDIQTYNKNPETEKIVKNIISSM